MALEDWAEISGGPLVLPINGKHYTVPEISIEMGARLNAVFAGTDDLLESMSQRELWIMCLGTAYDEMLADQVPDAALSRAGSAAFLFWRGGRLIAEASWNTGLDPEALAAQAAANQTVTASTPPMPSPSSVSENETPSRASTKTTTSRSGTPRARKTKTPANQSRGPRSSKSGRSSSPTSPASTESTSI